MCNTNREGKCNNCQKCKQIGLFFREPGIFGTCTLCHHRNLKFLSILYILNIKFKIKIKTDETSLLLFHFELYLGIGYMSSILEYENYGTGSFRPGK